MASTRASVLMEVQPKQSHQVTDEAHFKPLLQLKAGPALLLSVSIP